MNELREGLLRIAALFSYCGGPLFIADALKPRLGHLPPFLITFLPVGLMVMGAFFLNDDTSDRLSAFIVSAGRVALWVVLAMHLYVVGCFVNGVRVPDQALHAIGIVVGFFWSVVYLRAARRWKSSGEGPEDRHGSARPIEPT